jgi:hypothetical protein
MNEEILRTLKEQKNNPMWMLGLVPNEILQLKPKKDLLEELYQLIEKWIYKKWQMKWVEEGLIDINAVIQL